MHHEGSLLPPNLNQRSLSVVLDFDAGTGGKSGRAGGTDRYCDDGLPKRVRTVHRANHQHALGRERRGPAAGGGGYLRNP
jgi:hypothetical protein